MIAGLVGAITPLDELASDSVRRSRISFRFNIAHRRRWLMVQLVSMPKEDVTGSPSVGTVMVKRDSRPASLAVLMDDYCTTHGVTRWAA